MSIFNKFSLGKIVRRAGNKIGVFLSLFALVLNMIFVVNLPVASAGEVELGLDGAYYVPEDEDHLYALFTTDLSGMAEAIPSLAGNFSLLNETGDSCGVADSASLMASFHDVSNRFVDLVFSTVSCPESTQPVDLKLVDPGNAENYDIAGIENISAMGGGADPEFSFVSASNITQTSASLNGEITSTAEKTITRRGFRIGLDTGYGTGSVAVDDINGFPTGTYSINSPTLTCSTTYHVQAFVRDSDNIDYYGDDATFDTATCSVTTNDATDITSNSFTLNGTLFVTQTEYFTQRGFQYGTTDSYGQTRTEYGSWGSGTYNFSSDVDSGDACDTTYYFRAYAVSSNNQTFYGSGESLTTASCGGGGEEGGQTGLDAAYVDGTNFATIYAYFSMDLSAYAEMLPSLAGNFFLLDTIGGICATGSSASLMASFHDVSNQFVQVGFSGISCPDTGDPLDLKFVDPGNAEVFDIVAIDDVSDIGVVVSNDATNITNNSFTLNGKLFATGTNNYTSRGFQYGTTDSYGQTITESGSWESDTYNFSSDLNSGIECNTTYYFRAYATSSTNQTFYGSGESFTTASCEGGGEGGQTGLDAAYVDGTNFATIYAYFLMDLSEYAEMVPSLAGNFFLLDSIGGICATGSSASLMASFHDISNQFVQVGFSGISCPDTGDPVDLKYLDPSEVFDIVTIDDLSELEEVSDAVTAAETAGDLVCEFVDSDWQSLSSLEISMDSPSYNASSTTTSSGTLGSVDSFILVANPTSTSTWTLSIAPTNGPTALWSDGGTTYVDFNDDADGSDGDDADSVGGQFSIDPSEAIITPYSGDYTTTGLSLGASSSFDEGTVDSVTLMTAGATANAPGYWGLTGISLSQISPAGQAIGSYSLDLTISVI